MKLFVVVLFCLVVCAFFFESCKKNNGTTTDPLNLPSMEGTWELRQAQIKNIPLVNYPAGNGCVLKLTNAGYSTYSNGAFVRSGQYALAADTTVVANVCLVIPANEYRNRIVFDTNYTAPKTFVQLSNDTAKFLSGCFAVDSGSYFVYVKQ